MKLISYKLIEKENSETEFKNKLQEFLNRNLKVDLDISKSISNSVFSLYNSKNLYYHTYKHILYILKNAEVNQIELSDIEKAIIFFHDVIYNVGYKNNEENSALLFQALLKEFICEDMIFKTMKGIRETAKFLENKTNDQYHKILDLDLLGLGSSWDDFVASSKDIEFEFRKIYNISDFLNGRVNFIDLMIKKETIYRTECFSCFEEIARYNLGKEKDICLERLKNI